MKIYLRENFTRGRLTVEVKDDRAIWYFARSGERVIGYLKLGVDQDVTLVPVLPTLEIERIYVLREFHGKKVGQLLLDKAIEVATGRHAAYVWLQVWEKNMKAIGFYRKNGFKPYGRRLFKLGHDRQTDLLMKRPLSPR